MDVDKSFKAAVKIVQCLPKSGPVYVGLNQQLRFYALYKIATKGDNHTEKPHMWRLENRLKWESWYEMNGMDQTEAKQIYLDEMGEIVKEIYASGKIDEYAREYDEEFKKCSCKISKEDVNELMKAVYADETVTEEMKKKMQVYYKIFLNNKG